MSLGAAEFEQRWVVAPSAFGAWGRGPTSNGEACSDCHAARGRGHPPVTPEEPLRAGSVLADAPNLILTPHIAGVTQESNERVSSLVAERVAAFLRA